MRGFIFVLFLCLSSVAWGQDSSPGSSPTSKPSGSDAAKSSAQHTPNLEPPRSDRVNVNDLGPIDGESSSNDTQIDLSPPPDDAKSHPNSSDASTDADTNDVTEMHPWDPHRAAKDVEVGDFYFKRKNYKAAEDRYREALYYKDNDAMATYHLAECLEKMERLDDARAEYQSYLRILPHGPQAEDARKALDRLKPSDAGPKAAK